MKKIIFITILIIWILVIFSFSLQNGTESSGTSNSTLDLILNCLFINVENLKENNYELYYTLGSILRKCAHFTEYAVLGAISYNVFKKIHYSFIFCVLIASIDELIQTFVPNRIGAFTDVLIDSLGAIFGIIIIFIIYKKVNKRGIKHD